MTYTTTNFHRTLQSHLVALLDKKNIDKLEIATGILIEYNGFFLVVTAAHVLTDTSPDNLVINLGIPGQKYAMKKEKIWTHPNLDIAYIQLNTFEAKIFQNSTTVPFVFRSRIIRDISAGNLRCALCGFPKDLAKHNKESNVVEAVPALLTMRPLAPEQWPASVRERGRDPQFHFLLKHGPKHGNVSDQEGNTTVPINPKGMSGAAIFVYDPTTENHDHPCYSIFGIQTNFYPSSRLLLGTSIEPLFNQIQLDYNTPSQN